MFLNIDLYDSYTEADAPFYGDGIPAGSGMRGSGNGKPDEGDFVACGTDLARTSEGLARVQAAIPGFENFSMSAIGPQS